jgi:hypothetical protein
MQIEITDTEIKHGRRFSFCSCPIALGLLRQVPGAKSVIVSLVSIEVRGERGKRIASGLTSDATYDFILNFDNKKPVAPFAFELPDERFCKAEQGGK